jgi:hypothetical protein
MSFPRRSTRIYGTALAMLLFWGGALSGFDQGTYFLIRIVETTEATEVGGRMALQESLFSAVTKTAASKPIKPAEKSEFVIDFSDSLSQADDSDSFSGFQQIPKSPPPPATEDTDFSFGLNDSAFGE